MRSVTHEPTGRTAFGVLSVVTAALLSGAGCGLPTAVSGGGAVGPEAGDVNLDGVVDETDLDLATQAFGLTADDAAFVPEADLTGDGVIGLDDLQVLVTILNSQGNAVGA